MALISSRRASTSSRNGVARTSVTATEYGLSLATVWKTRHVEPVCTPLVDLLPARTLLRVIARHSTGDDKAQRRQSWICHLYRRDGKDRRAFAEELDFYGLLRVRVLKHGQ